MAQKKGLGSNKKSRVDTSDSGSTLKPLEYEASRLLASGSIKKAERLYRSILEAQPESLVAITNLSFICELKNKKVEQQYLLERLLSLMPDSFIANYNLGTIELHKENAHRAVTLLEKALQINASDPDCKYNLALAYQAQGKNEVSMRHYRELLDIGYDKPAVYTNLGICLYESGKITESLDVLGLAIKKYPNCTQALCQLAIESEYLADHEKSFSYLTRAINADPFCLSAYRRLCCLPSIERKVLYNLLDDVLRRYPSLKSETELIEALSCMGYEECLSLL